MAANVDRVDFFLPTVAWVPKGPSGLWDALVRATTIEPDVTELSSVAHLAYLARLAQPASDRGAEVVDLSLYRARRSA